MVKLNRKFYVRFFAAAVAICLISMIGATLVNTDFGHIEVTNFNIIDSKGTTIACTMYRPENATYENPAPGVVTLHGSYDSKETQDYTCLELARRGMVTVTMDCDGHGDSSNYKENPMDAFFTVTANPGSAYEDISTSPGSGMNDVVNYLYNSCDFIDKDQIGITGHSLGGKMANACLAYNKIQEYKGGVNKVAAVFLMGNQQLAIDGAWSDHLNYDPDDEPGSGDEIPLYYDVHYGVNAGQWDENNYKTGDAGPAWNFYRSNDARTLINELDNYDLQPGENVELGKIYSGTVQGSDKEYIRAMYQPRETHILNHYSLATTANLCDFFQNAFTAPNPIDAHSLTIQYKWIFNTIGVVGFFLAVFSFCCILLTTEFFGCLLAKREEDIYVPAAPEGGKNIAVYWIMLLLGSIIPALYMCKLGSWIGAHVGDYGKTRLLFGTRIWPQGCTFEQGVWTATAGIVGLLLFAAGYYLTGKASGVDPKAWNLKIGWKKLGITLLLAACSVGMGYVLAGLAKWMFQCDFRLMSYVVKWPVWEDFLVSLRFMPLLLIFFLANAMCQNLSNMVAGRKEWLNILLGCVFNILGLFIIFQYQYLNFITDGNLRLDGSRVMLSWPLFINLIVCTIISRRLYKKTGNVYLGAFINSIMFAIIGCANTMTLVCHNWWL